MQSAARRQKILERGRVDGVVENQQQPLALMPQALHHDLERRPLLLVRRDPAEPRAERNEIGPRRVRRLRPYPPSRAIIAAMLVRVSRGQRGLADLAQPMQRGDRDAGLVAL